MKQGALALCVLLLFASCGAAPELSSPDTSTGAGMVTTTEDGVSVTYESFDRQKYFAKRGKEPMILFFTSASCSSCALLDEALTQSASLLNGEVAILKVDMDREVTVARDLGVEEASVLVALNAQGEVVLTQENVVTFAQLQPLILAALGESK